MKFKVTDRNGYVLAEKLAERDRAEALATVAKIEQRLALEELCRASGGPRTGGAAHLMNRQTEPAAIFEISRGSRSPGAPMATRCLVGLLQVLRGWAGRLLGG